MIQTFYEDTLNSLSKIYRANLVNSLSGFKSANLIGTKNIINQENLCIVSSVIHIGSNPPLMGIVFRPNVVPRHTYENILETGFFTINSIDHSIIQKAHLTSAKLSRNESEFKAVGLTSVYKKDFFAPYVDESKINIGLSLEENITIESNSTHLVIGKILYIETLKQAIDSDGRVSLESLQTTCISGLGSYHKTKLIAQYNDIHLKDIKK